MLDERSEPLGPLVPAVVPALLTGALLHLRDTAATVRDPQELAPLAGEFVHLVHGAVPHLPEGEAGQALHRELITAASVLVVCAEPPRWPTRTSGESILWAFVAKDRKARLLRHVKQALEYARLWERLEL